MLPSIIMMTSHLWHIAIVLIGFHGNQFLAADSGYLTLDISYREGSSETISTATMSCDSFFNIDKSLTLVKIEPFLEKQTDISEPCYCALYKPTGVNINNDEKIEIRVTYQLTFLRRDTKLLDLSFSSDDEQEKLLCFYVINKKNKKEEITPHFIVHGNVNKSTAGEVKIAVISPVPIHMSCGSSDDIFPDGMNTIPGDVNPSAHNMMGVKSSNVKHIVLPIILILAILAIIILVILICCYLKRKRQQNKSRQHTEKAEEFHSLNKPRREDIVHPHNSMDRDLDTLDEPDDSRLAQKGEGHGEEAPLEEEGEQGVNYADIDKGKLVMRGESEEGGQPNGEGSNLTYADLEISNQNNNDKKSKSINDIV